MAPHLNQENSSKTPFLLGTCLDMIWSSQTFGGQLPCRDVNAFPSSPPSEQPHSTVLSSQGSHMLLAEASVVSLTLGLKKVAATVPRNFLPCDPHVSICPCCSSSPPQSRGKTQVRDGQ